MSFTLYEVMAANSPCYAANRSMTPTGIVVHSTGANNPYLKRYVQPDDGNIGVNIYGNSVNRADHRVIAHAYIGKDKNDIVKCYQTLPFDMACWSAGSGSKGSYNYDPNGRIQFEICEDNLKNEKYFNEAFDCAAEFCAYICKKYGFGVDKICSHKEGNAAGYASNHGDPENWLSNFNKDMDWFRKKVQGIIDAETEEKGAVIYRVQVGAFSKKQNAYSFAAELQDKGYSAYVTEANGVYRVQVGAFSKKAYAEAMVKELEGKGYMAFIK